MKTAQSCKLKLKRQSANLVMFHPWHHPGCTRRLFTLKFMIRSSNTSTQEEVPCFEYGYFDSDLHLGTAMAQRLLCNYYVPPDQGIWFEVVEVRVRKIPLVKKM